MVFKLLQITKIIGEMLLFIPLQDIECRPLFGAYNLVAQSANTRILHVTSDCLLRPLSIHVTSVNALCANTSNKSVMFVVDNSTGQNWYELDPTHTISLYALLTLFKLSKKIRLLMFNVKESFTCLYLLT